MTEARVVSDSDAPVTATTLAADLSVLGIDAGDIVMVHSSLRALGWVAGGAQTVVAALLEAVGSHGTIVMPAQSGHLSDPAAWSDPAVPSEWIETLRSELPAYDPYLTPVRAMGQIVEVFLLHRSTLRSDHPTLSFAANGRAAEEIISHHDLTPGFGESSPLGRLYEMDAKVLLMGVGHASNTSLHLGEHRATWPQKTTCVQGVPMMVGGERQWVNYDDLETCEDDFDELGVAFATSGKERQSTTGHGVARVFPMRDCVDFAVDWIQSNRQ
ncbi:MAG: AAC(3) family N-acetyltransferase [Actinobacteria bacterium]|nr:AAC(3) family N-acetyltransferase [Actinomycetota bacterium]